MPSVWVTARPLYPSSNWVRRERPTVGAHLFTISYKKYMAPKRELDYSGKKTNESTIVESTIVAKSYKPIRKFESFP